MAYVENQAISHAVTTDASFRAWAQLIHDSLVSVGLIQTSDTGQIDLTSVSTPGSNNTYAGYEIWRFNDSRQATDPIYIKLEYGRGGAAGRPSLRVSVGVGSNGSGTLTTPTSTIALTPSGTPTTPGYLHVSLLDGALTVFDVGALEEQNSMQFFVVERFRGLDGSDSFGGFCVFGASSAGNHVTMHYVKGGSATSSATMSHIASAPMSQAGAGLCGTIRARTLNVRPFKGILLVPSSSDTLFDLPRGSKGPVEINGTRVIYKRPDTLGYIILMTQSTSVNSQGHMLMLPHQ